MIDDQSTIDRRTDPFDRSISIDHDRATLDGTNSIFEKSSVVAVVSSSCDVDSTFLSIFADAGDPNARDHFRSLSKAARNKQKNKEKRLKA